MATIEEVTRGDYSIETMITSVRPSQGGHFARTDQGAVRDDGTRRGDLTPWFSPDGCTIERDNCASQDHATCRLVFTFTDEEVQEVFGVPEVPWSSMRLRPSMKLVSHSGHGETDWYNLGVFIPEEPARNADENPKVYSVDCHDLISIAALPTAGTFVTVGATPNIVDVLGTLYNVRLSGLSFAPNIPIRWGYPTQRPLPGQVPSQRQWVIGEETTWLLITDQLLEMAGWRPPWVDENGFLTSEPWRNSGGDRYVDILAADLNLTATKESVISLGATNKEELFGTPNYWVFIRSDFDPESNAPSVENGGIIVAQNPDDGPSSIQARGGRVVPSVQRVDAEDAAALREYADRAILMDRTPAKSLCLEVAPFPPPWHRGIADVTIEDLGIRSERFLIASWTLPLDGGDMSLTMDSISNII